MYILNLRLCIWYIRNRQSSCIRGIATIRNSPGFNAIDTLYDAFRITKMAAHVVFGTWDPTFIPIGLTWSYSYNWDTTNQTGTNIPEPA